MNSGKSTVFLVDDDAVMRKLLRGLLKSLDCRIEEFASGTEFLQRLPYTGPGCILLDMVMPDISGLELQQALKKAGCLLPVIFLTAHGAIPDSVQAIKAGALDFLQKQSLGADLLKSVGNAIEHSREHLKDQKDTNVIRTRFKKLTPREREVLEGVIAGKMNKQIAADLDTAEQTIKIHRGRVMEKMRADSVADLVRMVQKIGINLESTELAASGEQ